MNYYLTINIYPSSGSKKNRIMELKEIFRDLDKDSAMKLAGDMLQVVNLEHDRLEGYDMQLVLVSVDKNGIWSLIWKLFIIEGQVELNKKF